MGILSCFNGKAKTKDRDVHSAPPMLGGQTRPGALKSPPSPVRLPKDGRRSAPTAIATGSTETEGTNTTMETMGATDPNSPSDIPEALINTGNAASVAEVLGDAIIQKLNSGKWDEREQAIHKIKDRCQNEADTTDTETTDQLPLFNACCCIMRKAMNDKVAPVYFASCSLLDVMLETCANELNNDDVQAGIMPLMTAILARTGDTNQRVMDATCNILLTLARKQKLGLDFVGRYLTQTHKNLRKLRLVWGRLDLIRRAMLEFGFKRSAAFTPETVIPVIVPALDVADEKVRKLAIRIVIDVYKVAGRACIEKHIKVRLYKRS